MISKIFWGLTLAMATIVFIHSMQVVSAFSIGDVINHIQSLFFNLQKTVMGSFYQTTSQCYGGDNSDCNPEDAAYKWNCHPYRCSLYEKQNNKDGCGFAGCTVNENLASWTCAGKPKSCENYNSKNDCQKTGCFWRETTGTTKTCTVRKCVDTSCVAQTTQVPEAEQCTSNECSSNQDCGGSTADLCNPNTQPSLHWGVKNGMCLPSCGQGGGPTAVCYGTPCISGDTNVESYDCPYCCIPVSSGTLKCHCNYPNQKSPLNSFTCDDDRTEYCPSNFVCTSSDSWNYGSAPCEEKEVQNKTTCHCDYPNEPQPKNSYTCSERSLSAWCHADYVCSKPSSESWNYGNFPCEKETSRVSTISCAKITDNSWRCLTKEAALSCSKIDANSWRCNI